MNWRCRIGWHYLNPWHTQHAYDFTSRGGVTIQMYVTPCSRCKYERLIQVK